MSQLIQNASTSLQFTLLSKPTICVNLNRLAVPVHYDCVFVCLSYAAFSSWKTPLVLSPFRGGGLCTSMTRITMLAGVYTPVRATQARQVWRIEVRQNSSTASISRFTFLFLSPLLSYYSTFISPVSVLFSSMYHLFALIGRKAPFTHSLTCVFSTVKDSSTAIHELYSSFSNKE